MNKHREPLTDGQIRAAIVANPVEGWQTFIEQFTPTLVAIIRQGAVLERDDQLDVYVRVCDGWRRTTARAYGGTTRRRGGSPDG